MQASFLEPTWALVRQPRFAMSFGMAFFALSVSLTMAGVKGGDVWALIQKPSSIRHAYYNTQAKIVRYIDNSRQVLEMQAALRGIKRNMNPAEPGETKQKERKNDTTQQPEQKQDRNYSQTGDRLILAGDPLGPSNRDLPVVSVTTDRRFV